MAQRTFLTLLAGVCVISLSGYAAAQDAKAVAKGQELAVKYHCSTCHVLAGKGNKIGVAPGACDLCERRRASDLE